MTRDEDSTQEPETRDPLSDELYTARKQTFTTGNGWPHESKKGWKCKVNKLVEAGWCWDPSPEGDEPDGVTCFYCNLSLDGWEPKDDPFVEHKRREPQCPFFSLLEHYHGSAEPPKKGRAKSKARGSTASKASRMSTQSAMTAASDAQSLHDSLGDIPINSSLAHVDDSIMTAGTTASSATTTKGKKKTAKTKAVAKSSRSKKKVTNGEDVEIHHTDLEQEVEVEAEAASAPEAKGPSRTGRGSKQPTVLDSSVIEISVIDKPPPKKASRTRKPKTQPESEPQPEMEPSIEHGADEVPLIPQTPDAEAAAQARLSEVSAQLQDELEQSVDNFAEDLDQSTPVVQEQNKAKRGLKRMSNGLRKQQDSSSLLEVDAPSKPEPAPKVKRGRKSERTSIASVDAELEVAPEPRPEVEDQIEPDPLPTSQDAEADDENSQPKKAPAKKGRGRPKGKKNSSTRASKATRTSSELEPDVAEDLARDELEIEQELERIATQQLFSQQQADSAIQHEQDLVDEYDPSPTQERRSKDNSELQQLRDEVAAEAEKAFSPSSRVELLEHSSRMPGGFTPSPNGSDKENVPSSVMHPVTAQRAPQVLLSPTKPVATTRIPLAPGTPNRSPMKMSNPSPSKQVAGLQSRHPWNAIDLDTVLLPSPQPSPGRVGEQLVAAAGQLTSPEKKMSVEEWVRYQAEQSEVELRRKCERMVEAFEKQGMRAMESLMGVDVIG